MLLLSRPKEIVVKVLQGNLKRKGNKLDLSQSLNQRLGTHLQIQEKQECLHYKKSSKISKELSRRATLWMKDRKLRETLKIIIQS